MGISIPDTSLFPIYYRTRKTNAFAKKRRELAIKSRKSFFGETKNVVPISKEVDQRTWEGRNGFTQHPEYKAIGNKYIIEHSAAAKNLIKPPSSTYGLKEKERKFCAWYLKLGSAAKAAIQAGYRNPNYGYRLLKNPVFKIYLNYLKSRMSDQDSVTLNWKLDQLKKVVECAFDGRARQNEHSEIDPKAAIAAISEMNKMQGHHAPTEVKNSSTHGLDMEQFKALCEQHRKEY